MNSVTNIANPTTVHIINHTHWDREWFLTSVYTSRWIPGLIDKLEQLAAANPQFRFLLDGQTLVIEDLLESAPAYGARVRRLIANGHLIVGPYYCQPDWKLTDGELLIRNLQYGQRDVQALGGAMKTGWLVDIFGHISQSPQIHRLFDIQAVYVWRGVPRLTPYFDWEGADGSRLFTINLFGGYRNLYGVTHAPAVAVTRLYAEVEKLRPYYPTVDIPLFDGYDYRQIFDAMQEDLHKSLTTILGEFAAGLYAVSSVPFAVDQWQATADELLHVQTDGVGVWPVQERVPIEKAEESITVFAWHNDYYTAAVDAKGVVHVGQAALGALVVSAEHGDTYSDEGGDQLGIVRADSALVVEQRSAHHAVVRFSGAWRGAEAQVAATVRLTFDPSPVIKWQIALDSRGQGLRVEAVFETARQGKILAGMPFDVVERPAADTDLMPRQLPPELANTLLGQRELGAVRTFPFDDFVAISDALGTVAVLARGLHAYTADDRGTIRLMLRRAVEWLTRADLKNRVGDAGPFFYVPDARCERTVRHQLGVAFGPFAGDSMAMQRLNLAFQNPPLIARSRGEGIRTTWRVLKEDAPLSSLQMENGSALARLYNSTPQVQPLSRGYRQTDVWGMPGEEVRALLPKAIVTVALPASEERPAVIPPGAEADVQILTPLAWRVGETTGLPDPAILAQLEDRIAAIDEQLARLQVQLDGQVDDRARLLLLHRVFVLQREQAEFRLSLALNRRKLTEGGGLRYEYLYRPDEEIATIGLELNRLRIKRRIFDYVVAALAGWACSAQASSQASRSVVLAGKARRCGTQA